jgi:hypothetical protein
MIKLSEIEECKGTKDEVKLGGLIEQLFDIQHDISRLIIDRILYRNILYYIGEQYIEFIKSAGTFRRKLLPAYIPTPVSNQIKDFVRAVKSALINQKLVPTVSPNTGEPEDNQAAELGSKLLEWMDGINDGEFQEEKEKLVIMLALNGTAFMRTYPDMDAGQWFMDKDKLMKTGEVVTRTILPFSVRMDRFGDRMTAKRWIGLQSLQSREWVEDMFHVKIDTSPAADMIDYERKLMKLVSQVSPWKGAGLEAQTWEEDEDLVLLREAEFKPTIKFPKGRYIVCCQTKVLLDSERLPIKSEKESWYYTLSDFHYDYVPGRYWSEAPVNDLISPQNAINEIDQLLAINRKGIGRPRVTSPSDIGLKRIGEGGHSFMILKYDALLSGGQKPTIEQGIPLPEQIIEERGLHLTTIQDVSGDPKNVLKGHAPSASSSGIQIDILRETAERGHYPDLERYNRDMGKVYKKRLLLAKELYTEKRQIKISGRGRKMQVLAFKGSDLRDNTDVKLELDSGISTTRAGQTQLIMQLAEKGMFGDVMNNPDLREELVSRMGLSGLTSQSNVDMERAEAEDAAIAAGHMEDIMLAEPGQPDPTTGQPGEPTVVNDDPLFKYDNHAIHFEVHRRFILSSAFEGLPLKAKTIAFAHADLHESIVQQTMAAQAAAAAEQQQNAGPGGKPTGQGGKSAGPSGNGGKTPLTSPGAGGHPMPMTESRLAERDGNTGGRM